MSDIHFEFGRGHDLGKSYVPPPADVTILAEDISTGVAGIMWAQEVLADRPVIYVPGNHEYYGKRIYAQHLERMRAKAVGSNVHLMNEDVAEIDGVVFIGATLWTDYNLYGNAPLAMLRARSQMNDHIAIHEGERKPITPETLLRHHESARYFITEALLGAKNADKKAVVVTHHAPSEMSVAEKYRGDPLNPCYASRLENLILDFEPVAWFHGHMHDTVDYTIGSTRVRSNPRGYVGHELNPHFDPHLVINV